MLKYAPNSFMGINYNSPTVQGMMQQNPQMAQLLTQFQNMSKGKDPRKFVAQLARQRGMSEQNISAIQQMFNKQ